jgi:hypothetical protein
MSLKVRCAGCGEILKKPGGILFGPPATRRGSGDAPQFTEKKHLCVECTGRVDAFVLGIEWKEPKRKAKR